MADANVIMSSAGNRPIPPEGSYTGGTSASSSIPVYQGDFTEGKLQDATLEQDVMAALAAIAPSLYSGATAPIQKPASVPITFPTDTADQIALLTRQAANISGNIDSTIQTLGNNAKSNAEDEEAIADLQYAVDKQAEIDNADTYSLLWSAGGGRDAYSQRIGQKAAEIKDGAAKLNEIQSSSYTGIDIIDNVIRDFQASDVKRELAADIQEYNTNNSVMQANDAYFQSSAQSVELAKQQLSQSRLDAEKRIKSREIFNNANAKILSARGQQLEATQVALSANLQQSQLRRADAEAQRAERAMVMQGEQLKISQRAQDRLDRQEEWKRAQDNFQNQLALRGDLRAQRQTDLAFIQADRQAFTQMFDMGYKIAGFNRQGEQMLDDRAYRQYTVERQAQQDQEARELREYQKEQDKIRNGFSERSQHLQQIAQQHRINMDYLNVLQMDRSYQLSYWSAMRDNQRLELTKEGIQRELEKEQKQESELGSMAKRIAYTAQEMGETDITWEKVYGDFLTNNTLATKKYSAYYFAADTGVSLWTDTNSFASSPKDPANPELVAIKRDIQQTAADTGESPEKVAAMLSTKYHANTEDGGQFNWYQIDNVGLQTVIQSAPALQELPLMQKSGDTFQNVNGVGDLMERVQNQLLEGKISAADAASGVSAIFTKVVDYNNAQRQYSRAGILPQSQYNRVLDTGSRNIFNSRTTRDLSNEAHMLTYFTSFLSNTESRNINSAIWRYKAL